MRALIVAGLILPLLNPMSATEAAAINHSKGKHLHHAALNHPQPPQDTPHYPEEVSEARIFQIPDNASLPSGRPPPEVKQAEPTTATAAPGSTPGQADCIKDPRDPRCYAATIQAHPIGR